MNQTYHAACRAVLACGLALGALSALAQSPRALTLTEGEPRIRLDGRLDDSAWQRAESHDAFSQFLPLDRQPPPAGYRTTLQIVVERDALVFGIRAWDPEPAQLRADPTRRDQVRRDQDFVAVYIDAVGDRRAAQFVRVSAAGVIGDGVYVAAGDSEDTAPDFEVEAAVALEPDGYSVELRVPLMALRYPHEGGAAWRAMAARSVPRASSVLLLSVPLTKDGLSFIAEMPVVPGLEDVAERARHQSLLLVRPEITARVTQQRVGTAAARREHEVSVGAQLKWRPRADWVFDATLNPDFSQVELDAPQLAGNTRFALSVPEKRPFFLESTDVIDQPIGGFYSRSVTDPRYGLRATWRDPGADATAMTLQDEGGGLVLRPGPYGTAVFAQDGRSQVSLLRARRHALGGADITAGILLSHRRYADDRGDNRVAGVDLLWLPNAQDQVRLRGLASRTTAGFDAGGQAVRVASERGHWIEILWNRRSRDWIVNLDIDDIASGFRNDNGFVDQAGVRRFELELNRRWGEVALPGFVAHEFETYVWTQQALSRAAPGVAAGVLMTRRWHPGIWFVGPLNAEGWAQLRLDAERVRPDGRLHPVNGVAFGGGVNPAPWMPRIGTEIAWGDRVDVEADRVGRGGNLMLEVRLRGSWGGLGWEAEPKLQHAVIRRDGRTALTDSAVRWLGVLHFDARHSLRAVWQASAFRRHADPAVPLAAGRYDSRTASLVFQHRVGLGRNVSVGFTHSRAGPGAPGSVQRDDELFVKAAFDM